MTKDNYNGITFIDLIKYLTWPKTEYDLLNFKHLISNCSPK